MLPVSVGTAETCFSNLVSTKTNLTLAMPDDSAVMPSTNLSHGAHDFAICKVGSIYLYGLLWFCQCLIYSQDCNARADGMLELVRINLLLLL